MVPTEKKKRILLVEDDPLIIKIYTTRLEKAGFEIDVIEKGAGVVDRLEEDEFDLLLLDIVLPERTGFEILRDVRKANFDGLKTLILSNIAQKEKIERALNLGADAYLIKAHFTPTEIIEKIKEALKK